jgi:hypothetical protein
MASQEPFPTLVELDDSASTTSSICDSAESERSNPFRPPSRSVAPNKCSCKTSCHVLHEATIVSDARTKDEAGRHSALVSMLFACASHGLRARGMPVCAEYIQYLFQVSRSTLERCMAQAYSPFVDKPRRKEMQPRVRTLLAQQFIMCEASLEGCISTNTRHSAGTILLPSTLTKKNMYERYTQQVPKDVQVKEKSFFDIWLARCPQVKIAALGSDYCNICSAFAESGQGDDEEQRIHLAHATRERLEYNRWSCDEVVPSFTIDFAENILLPYLHMQPQQQYFTTKYICDIFGIIDHKRRSAMTILLPEGDWPGSKSPAEVISIFHHCIEAQGDMRITADNCSSQNKNYAMLYYLCLRIVLGLERHIVLHFLVAGHTKNACDELFGRLKKGVKASDIYVPQQIVEFCSSAKDSVVYEGKAIPFLDFTKFLERHFNHPSAFKITAYHWFDVQEHAMVRAKAYSEMEWTPSVSFLRNGHTEDMVRAEFAQFVRTAQVLPNKIMKKSKVKEVLQQTKFIPEAYRALFEENARRAAGEASLI